MTNTETITCERCGRTTTDKVTITEGGGRWWPHCAICGPLLGQDYEGDAEAVALRHEQVGGFERPSR